MDSNVHYVERGKVIEYTQQHPLVLVHWYASVLLILTHFTA